MTESTSNGFWKVGHNELKALLRRIDLNWGLVRVFLAISDLTHGRANPAGDRVSMSQICEVSAMDRRHVSRALKRLARLGLYGQESESGGMVRRWAVWPVPAIASQGNILGQADDGSQGIASQGTIALQGTSASQGNSASASQGTKLLPPRAPTKTRREKTKRGTQRAPIKFTPPVPQEITTYAASIGYHLDGHRFVDFYEARGWMIGKNRMKSWKAAVRTWKTRDLDRGGVTKKPAGPLDDAFDPTPEEAQRWFEQAGMVPTQEVKP